MKQTMNYQGKKQIIFCLFFVILITSCSSGSRLIKNSKTPPSQFSNELIYKGTDSLTLEFMKNVPPDTIFASSFSQLGFTLANEGSFDIVNGFLSLSLEKDYLEITNWQLKDIVANPLGSNDIIQFELMGKHIENPYGETALVSARIESTFIPPEQPPEHETTIIATACYPYQTVLFDTVCIDTDQLNSRN